MRERGREERRGRYMGGKEGGRKGWKGCGKKEEEGERQRSWEERSRERGEDGRGHVGSGRRQSG